MWYVCFWIGVLVVARQIPASLKINVLSLQTITMLTYETLLFVASLPYYLYTEGFRCRCGCDSRTDQRLELKINRYLPTNIWKSICDNLRKSVNTSS